MLKALAILAFTLVTTVAVAGAGGGNGSGGTITVPEPASIALLVAGIAGVIGLRNWRK